MEALVYFLRHFYEKFLKCKFGKNISIKNYQILKFFKKFCLVKELIHLST